MSQQKFTALPSAFNAANVPPAVPFEALPIGWYPVDTTDGEVKPTEGGAGIRMEMEFTVLDGPFKGRKVFDGFNYIHSSAKAQEIAQQQISAICHATGVIQLADVQLLFNHPFELQVGIEAGRWVDGANKEVPIPAGHPANTPPPGALKWYDAKNRFKGARPIGGAAAAPVLPAGAPAWAAGKAGAPGGPAAPAPVASAPTNPPWGAPAAKPAVTLAPVAPVAPVAAAAEPAKPRGPRASKPKVRNFHVFMPDNTVSAAKPETEIATMLATGMPASTMLNPEGGGDDDWKPASDWAIAAPAFPAPVAATPAGVPVAPPWAR